MDAMSLWEKANPCCGCKHFFNPKDGVLICKKDDKFILPEFPPLRCEDKEG